jgi:tripartite-type tricarboxylate transporter receptor subunit TctC
MPARFLAALAAALLGLSGWAFAQGYPSRPSSSSFPFGRWRRGRRRANRGDGMRSHLGQSVIVENVTGAGGSIATGRVARAQPDGYTLIAGQWGTHVANSVLYKLDYDVVTDFEPIGLITHSPLLLVGRKDLPASDLKGLVAWLKANPSKASAGTSGAGGLEHVPGLLFQKATGNAVRIHPLSG